MDHPLKVVLSSIVPLKILGVIPARYASSRFPGKALVSIAGKSMLQHVWERASKARYLSSVLIATDDERIRAAAEQFGAKVVMTRADHVSGTDRVAEAASATDAPIIVNIQGDEPLIDPEAIDAAVLALVDDSTGPNGQENGGHHSAVQAQMSTLMKRIDRAEDIADPNVVKVVTDLSGHALYFSRSPIPFEREPKDGRGTVRFKHIGLYVYRRKFLLKYSELPMGPLEQAERLEQMRALENGYKIRVVETEYDSLGVDTPEDWNRVAALFEKPLVAR